MAIYITANSKILVQGMTGSEGTKHTRRMVASGSNVVAGVTPGKGADQKPRHARTRPVPADETATDTPGNWPGRQTTGAG